MDPHMALCISCAKTFSSSKDEESGGKGSKGLGLAPVYSLDSLSFLQRPWIFFLSFGSSSRVN
jgi:hypothetical protein